ncbi:MAG TPA: DUF2071 domain-containing protein [Candidatus Baltobacteraceae bacterium]|jgi:hypothetical protein|nr:DUF2071 domain-containing protein [Candidatus Baltobacteraceae bacterium]
MRIPVIKGTIKRRLLVNYRADPAVVQRILPPPFRPKLHRGSSLVGICLIRLEQIRPAGLPGALGLSSENAAHRIAVEWTDAVGTQREGVFIPRRDTGSFLNRVAGGRIFPGEHHPAQFFVVDIGGHIELTMRSLDGSVSVTVVGEDSDVLATASCFKSLREASEFFEGGSLGYSPRRDTGRLDGLLLHTVDWRIRALSVTKVHSSFFADQQRFPEGSIEFDHALVMRDILHEWRKADDLYEVSQSG